MNKTRVLVVDDSPVIRKIITKALQKESEIEVVGFAGNGVEAIEAVEKLLPDLITLDIEMPVMDGLAALQEIRKVNQALPIIMFSSLTQGGGDAVVKALTLGASECVGKPDHATGSLESVYEVLERELIPKIIELGRYFKNHSCSLSTTALDNTSPEASRRKSSTIKSESKKSVSRNSLGAICIGSSTGGPMALMQIFSQINEVVKCPIFLVQHMPATFTGLLATRLSGVGGMVVKEASDGEVAEPGVAYLAPGGFHMKLSKVDSRVIIRLNTDAPENNCRPAVDVLFRTAAEIYRDGLMGIILTGMGSDGLRGCQAIADKLGYIVVQDEASSVVWGMPGSVAQAGLANLVLPIERISAEIKNRVKEL